jgi:hypothetical protein
MTHHIASSFGTLVLAGALALAGGVTAARADETATGADVRREVSQAVQTIEGYGAAQRDQALQEGNRLLRAMDRRIAAMQGKAGSLTGEAKTRWEHTMATLQRRRADAAASLERLRDDTGQAWGKVRDGFGDAVEKLGDAFAEAADAFH